METNRSKNYSHIKGWGVDVDPENEPTYPMKLYTGDDHNRLNWERPPQQPRTVEVLKSNERPSVPAVFGTSLPPSGLSGVIRRQAFNYSESSFGHWLPLLLADRVNVVEGFLDDIRSGRIPNIFAEKGGKAAWKHNRRSVLIQIAGTVLAAGAIALFLAKRTKSRS